MNDIKDSTCILPFLHLFVRTDGVVAPCCVADALPINIEGKEADDIVNDQHFKDIRKQMLSGIKPKVCNICFKNGHPMRNDFNKLWSGLSGMDYVTLAKKLVDENHEIKEIKSTDLRFSNLCNFSCRMCAPIYSTNWYEDAKTLYPTHEIEPNGKPIKIGNNFVQKLDKHTGNLNWVYLAGGEPLIMEETYEYLHQLLPSSKDIEIVINTNLSVLKYKKIDVPELLANFKNCHLVISCDGIEKMGEYIRTGFYHKKFFENVEKVHTLSKELNGRINFSFNFTISIFNVFHTFKFIKYIIDNGYFNDNIMIQWVTYPYHLSVGNAGSKFKEKVKDFYRENISNTYMTDKMKGTCNGFIEYLDKFEPTDNGHNTLEFIQELDKLRNSNYKELCPWVETEINE